MPLVHVRLRASLPARTGHELLATQVLAALVQQAAVSGSRAALACAAAGGRLRVSADADGIAVRGVALREGLAFLLHAVLEAFQRQPSDGELTVAADQVAATLGRRAAQPHEVARQALLPQLFGAHAYGTHLPPASLGSTELAAAVLTARQRLTFPGATVVVVGDVPATAVPPILEEVLGRWTTGPPPKPAPRPAPPPSSQRGGPAWVERPGSTQSCILLGGRFVPPRDPHRAAAELADIVLGGHFDSRLVRNLREDKGVCYSPRSTVHHGEAASWFEVIADVAGHATGPALQEIERELTRLCRELVGEDELAAAKRYRAGVLLRSRETQADTAGALEDVLVTGLPLSWPQDHAEQIAAVAAEEVREQASRLYEQAKTRVAVAGEPTHLQAARRHLGR